MSVPEYVNSKCWDCHYALNAEIPPVCCWADRLKPRSDWTAIWTGKTSCKDESYFVCECPQFLSDKEYKKRKEEEQT